MRRRCRKMMNPRKSQHRAHNEIADKLLLRTMNQMSQRRTRMRRCQMQMQSLIAKTSW